MRRLPLLASRLNFRLYLLLAALVVALALGGAARAGEAAPSEDGPVERLEIVTSFPMTNIGKIDKKELRRIIKEKLEKEGCGGA